MIKPDYISLKSWVVAGLLSVTGLVAATTFLAPNQAAASNDLRSATISRKNYNEAMSSIDQQIKQEESDSSIRPECRTYTKTHGKRAAKAVLMIHGISGCSNVYQKLADAFYNQGYNVYVPRVPKHGYTDNKRHGEISTKDIASFMKTSAQQVSGLGDELGIVGHSGGGDMATWLAQYGNGLFSRVLLIAPFYEPAKPLSGNYPSCAHCMVITFCQISLAQVVCHTAHSVSISSSKRISRKTSLHRASSALQQ